MGKELANGVNHLQSSLSLSSGLSEWGAAPGSLWSSRCAERAMDLARGVFVYSEFPAPSDTPELREPPSVKYTREDSNL